MEEVITLEQVEQELIQQGADPNDFNIKITETGYSVTPKWFYENKQIAKNEVGPTKEDVETVADTVVYLMGEVERLSTELEALKNG
ncbi:hypothetical protein [Desulfosporosinus sp. OT]|uniref:hypothetical protein n=1 Tax=Desulfosporosinus sp. OT TaxID=913865 RepID=UPI000223A922|nr:hypothetical protein [Desulfosporosinus sp. OT]EGW39092.1 hypothetical protein DOT_3043 [Desulfosporosinus sp. OT]